MRNFLTNDGRRVWAARMVMLSVLAAPLPAIPQETFEPVANDAAQLEVVERIQRLRESDGPNSAGLIDPLTTLSLLYEESGDHVLAAAAIEQALHVVRVNFGLHSLDQASLIRQAIRAEEAIGDHVGAWELEQELLELVERHPDDLRTVPILREVADRRMDVLDRYLAGENPPEIELGCYRDWLVHDQRDSCMAGSRSAAAGTLNLEAQRYYADAIAVILRNEDLSSPELLALETELLRSNNLIRNSEVVDALHPDIRLNVPPRSVRMTGPWRETTESLLRLADWELPKTPDAPVVERGWLSGSESEVFPSHVRHDSPHDYRLGRLSLQRLFSYAAATSDEPLSQVHALIAIADWDLLYSRNSVAMDGYELAIQTLNELGELSAIDEIFMPKTPTALPTFAPNPFDRDETRQSVGYIDVSFEIAKYGNARRIEIVDATSNATEKDKDKLIRFVARNRFRPRWSGTEFASGPRLVVRSYLYE